MEKNKLKLKLGKGKKIPETKCFKTLANDK